MSPSVVNADLDDRRVAELVELHIARSAQHMPPGALHAFGIAQLRQPAVSVWAIWQGDRPLAVGALRVHGDDHGEVKSMHVVPEARGRGLGRLMLDHIIAEARRRSLPRLCLETGYGPFFTPARQLYEAAGFRQSKPFAGYEDDPDNLFMMLALH